jgi:hypothetical protein
MENTELLKAMQEMMTEMIANQETLVKIKDILREEIKSGQVEMRSTVSALGNKMGALIAGMKDGQKEMVACRVTTEACQEKKKRKPDNVESEVERRDVPMEEAAVKFSRIMKKQHRGQHITAGRQGKPRKLTRGDCRSQGMLVAACRKVSHHAAMAWRGKNIFRNIRTCGYCGSLRKLTIAGRKMIHHAREASSGKIEPGPKLSEEPGQQGCARKVKWAERT